MLTQLLLNGLVSGAGYALVALGFGLVYSTTRFFHFAHGGVYTAAAYTAYFVRIELGLPMWGALASGVLAGMFLGAILDVRAYQPLKRRGATATAQLLASLGILIAIQNGIALLFGDDTKSMRTGPSHGVAILNARVTAVQISTIAACILLCLGLDAALRRTRIGRTIRAVADDSNLANILGIRSEAVVLTVFTLGSALAGVAAILASLDTDLRPTMGFDALLAGMVAAVVGGIGSAPGALAGGLLIGFAEQLGVWNLPSQWQGTIMFLVLTMFLLFRPEGFFGKRIRGASA